MMPEPSIDNLWYGIGSAWPDAVVEGLWRACWQGGLLLLGVWVVCRLFPRLPVSVRHWLWWLACLKLVVALCWFTPVRLAVLPATLLPLHVDISEPVWRPLLFLTLFWAFWLVGASVSLLVAGRQVVRLRRALRSARDAKHTEIAAEVAALSAQMGLRRVPGMALCEAVQSPLIVGLFRPRIVLPAAFKSSFFPEERQMVIAHELAHLRRRDLWLATVPLLAQTLFFFLPCIGRACREWTQAREALCDAEALRVTGCSPTAYQIMLLKVALCGGDGQTFVSLGMTSGYHTLAARLALLERCGDGVAHRGGHKTALMLAAVSVPLLLPFQITTPYAVPPTYDDVRQTIDTRIASKLIQTYPTARYRITNLSLMYPGLRHVLGINAEGQILGYGNAAAPSRNALRRSTGIYVWLLDGKGGCQNLGLERTREGLPDLGTVSRDFLPQPCRNAAGEWINWHKTLTWHRYYDPPKRERRESQWVVRIGRYRDGRQIGWEALSPEGITLFPQTWNRHGEVIGEAEVRLQEGTTTHAVLYDGKRLRDLGALGNPLHRSVAFGLNTHGDVVGSAYPDAIQERAFVYRNGRMTDLNTLIPPDAEWVLNKASSINDAGQIVGYGRSDARSLLYGIGGGPLPSILFENEADSPDIFLLTPNS